MTRHPTAPNWAHVLLPWLIGAGIGPAVVAVPVNWAADALAGAARRWFRRLRRADDLSRLVKAAANDSSVDLSHGEFGAVRRLLEDRNTWSLLRHGTVGELADQIASCLPPRDGRTAHDSHAAALGIARGLLEFAVADLEPKLFQQVLLARLQRMEAAQATTLDEALMVVQGDLAARLEAQGQLGTEHFATLVGHLKRVLDRLPPGPADRGEIVVYLKTLIDWLSIDPWPHRFGQSALMPAAIERKLRVSATSPAHEQDVDADAYEQDVDADELARHYHRLVILGGPGSGKTWLAMRAVRTCAEEAQKAIAADAALDDIELPLYTTFSRLANAGGDIRQAVVSSALERMGDLGGSRISRALHMFFMDRNGPTLLVIDSLDEAHNADTRLREVGTIRPPWRIIITSRPSSWNDQQFPIKKGDPSERIGRLEPLRYPDDVEPFILGWFDQEPDRGEYLVSQINRRPDLQQGATVPLILAFYCILGGNWPDRPLPEFRHKLHADVLNCILTGGWRGSNDRQPDVDTCLRTLRNWAWSGETSDPISGVGTWADDIATDRIGLGNADEGALNHVAVPLGPPDFLSGRTLRRFIHRSLREYLVAEYVAGLPADQAAEILLPHLWYDPDWEHVAPAAIAMHPQHDQLLRALVCRAAESQQLPADFSVIDGGWELRRLLARVAAESTEADWPEMAGVIGHARVDLARSGRTGQLGGAASWSISNRQSREVLLRRLARVLLGEARWSVAVEAGQLVDGVMLLRPTAADKRQARKALLELLVGGTNRRLATGLAHRVAGLSPTKEDRCQTRQVLIALLAGQTGNWMDVADQTSGSEAAELVPEVVQLSPTREDRRQVREALLGLLPRQTDGWVAAEIVGGVVQLSSTREDRRQVREALLGLLPRQTDGWVAIAIVDGVIQLGSTVAGARQALLRLLARQTDSWVAAVLAAGVAQLGPTAADRRQARETLLGLLARQPRGGAAMAIVGGVIQLAATAADRRQARETLLGLLVRQTDSWVAAVLAAGVAQLGPTAADRRQARRVLLGLLIEQDGQFVGEKLASAVMKLDPTAADRRIVRETLLGLLASETRSWVAGGSWVGGDLTDEVVQLAATAADKRQARQALLRLLARQADGSVAKELASGVARLSPTREDRRRARKVLLGLLGSGTQDWVAGDLTDEVVELAATAADKRQARQALLRLLARQADGSVAAKLASAVMQLDPTAADRHQARETLLSRLASCWASDYASKELVDGVIQLAVTATEKRQVRQALLGWLASPTDGLVAVEVVRGVAQLGPTREDWRQARQALLGLLASQTDDWVATVLMDTLAQLSPTARDLNTWPTSAAPLATEVLGAVRRNSTLADWLHALPSLASLCNQPAGPACDPGPPDWIRAKRVRDPARELRPRPRGRRRYTRHGNRPQPGPPSRDRPRLAPSAGGMITRLSQRHTTRLHAIRWSSQEVGLLPFPGNTLRAIPSRSEVS
jgi:hypothetical protein